MPENQQVQPDPAEQRSEHSSRTRYLKPVEPVNFSNHEMLQGVFAAVSPAMVSSVNQLHGERKGVVRVTCKNNEGLSELEGKIQGRRIQINGVRLAPVAECGHFVKVTLVDVPSYLTSQDIERDLREYGPVIHVKREYLDYNNYKIENETRMALFSYLIREIPSRVAIDNADVFASYRLPTSKRSGYMSGDDPLLVTASNIPKHVMNSMAANTSGEGIREKLKHHIADNTKTGSLPFPRGGDSARSSPGESRREPHNHPREKRGFSSVGTCTSLNHLHKERSHQSHHTSSVEIQTDDPLPGGSGSASGQHARHQSQQQLFRDPGSTHVVHRRRASYDYEGQRDGGYDYPPRERSKTPNGETHI